MNPLRNHVYEQSFCERSASVIRWRLRARAQNAFYGRRRRELSTISAFRVEWRRMGIAWHFELAFFGIWHSGTLRHRIATEFSSSVDLRLFIFPERATFPFKLTKSAGTGRPEGRSRSVNSITLLGPIVVQFHFAVVLVNEFIKRNVPESINLNDFSLRRGHSLRPNLCINKGLSLLLRAIKLI